MFSRFRHAGFFSTMWTVAHQARILEWLAMSSSRGSSWARDPTHLSCIVSCSVREFFTAEPQGKPKHFSVHLSRIFRLLWGSASKWSHAPKLWIGWIVFQPIQSVEIYEREIWGTSLMVQWLRLHASTEGGTSLIPAQVWSLVRGPRSHMLHGEAK